MLVKIDYDLCENGQTCESVCPEDVFKEEGGRIKVVAQDLCNACWLCVDNCSAGAIEVD